MLAQQRAPRGDVDSPRWPSAARKLLSGPRCTSGASSNGRKIAHLRNHDFEHQIGNIKEISEDSFGLKVVSTLGKSTKGNDALLDYQDGILREHSIGFNYVQDKIKFIEESSLNEAGH